MDKNHIYEAPSVELITICSEENILVSNLSADGITVANPFSNNGGDPYEQELD
jgi:hypothetical protein